jgi:hypothetical protein
VRQLVFIHERPDGLEGFITMCAPGDLRRDLERLAPPLAAADVPFLVLKGPVLARTIYPSLDLRPYTDLDLTVRPEHEHAAVQTLVGEGYREDRDPVDDVRRARAGTADAWAPFHRRFSTAAMPSVVELHLDPLQLGLRPVCEAERWQRARPLADVPGAFMLCPEDNLVQLAVHVHKHGYERLIWLKDIDLAARRWADRLDWDLVERVARLEGVAASVWYGLGLAGRLLGTPVPRPIIARLRPSPPMRVLYRAIWPVEQIANLDARMHRRAVQCELGESWRDMLPALVVMGRRRARACALASALLARLSNGRCTGSYQTE